MPACCMSERAKVRGALEMLTPACEDRLIIFSFEQLTGDSGETLADTLLTGQTSI